MTDFGSFLNDFISLIGNFRFQPAKCTANTPFGVRAEKFKRPPLNRRRTGRHHEVAARRRFQVNPVQRQHGEIR